MLDWVQGPFINGLMAIGSLPGGKKYIQAVDKIGLQEKWGVILTPWRANDLCTPQSWIEMFEIKKKPEMIAPIRKELDQIMDIVSKQDDGLEFAEKNNMKWSWCDALYIWLPSLLHGWEKLPGNKSIAISYINGGGKYRHIIMNLKNICIFAIKTILPGVSPTVLWYSGAGGMAG